MDILDNSDFLYETLPSNWRKRKETGKSTYICECPAHCHVHTYSPSKPSNIVSESNVKPPKKRKKSLKDKSTSGKYIQYNIITTTSRTGTKMYWYINIPPYTSALKSVSQSETEETKKGEEKEKDVTGS